MDIDIKDLIKAAAEGMNLKDFKGDVVGVKVVENEIGNVEAGGIGVQKVYSNKSETTPQKKKAKKMPNSKPEKQHGVAYPVFSKGLGVTDYHIKALYLYLTARGWISTQTKEVDFLRLFNGKDNDCEIIWTGHDKLGDNPKTELGKSALYVLFKTMSEGKIITTGIESERVGPILESHFVDTEGLFLTDISNTNTTSKKANDYINKILATMRMRADDKFIQEKLDKDLRTLIEQEGVEKYDKNDRQDLNYRRRH